MLNFPHKNRDLCRFLILSKENEFDWSWEANINQLQIIWRPEEQSNKMITMIIEDADYNVVIRTIVYYKIILEY